MNTVIEGKDIMVRIRGKELLDVKKIGLKKGEIFAVIGPNGAGKSTLLRVMALLQVPQRGEIYFKGEKITQKERIRIRRKMAVVFQEPLFLNETVIENIALGLRIRGIKHREAIERAKCWLERFKVEKLSNRWARSLSGGEAQRVSLARAFALEPEVLFLDEPFSNLDVFIRESLIADFFEVLKTTGITTFFITHDLEEVMLFANRVMVLMGGKVVQEGTPQELLENPKTDELKRFIQAWERFKFKMLRML